MKVFTANIYNEVRRWAYETKKYHSGYLQGTKHILKMNKQVALLLQKRANESGVGISNSGVGTTGALGAGASLCIYVSRCLIINIFFPNKN